MNVAEIMSRNPLRVSPQTTIIDAAQLMLRHRISGLPVTDEDGAMLGIVTEGDLLRRAEIGTERRRARWLAFLLGPGRLAEDYVDANARKVGELMTSDLATVSPADNLAEVVRLMEKRHVKRVPVVADGKLVGIVSRADLVRALLDKLTRNTLPQGPDIVSDQAISDRIREILNREPWGPRFSVDVIVEDGTVELHGTVTDERERAAVTVAAENVPGVKAVHDHLVWVEPTSGIVIGADEAR